MFLLLSHGVLNYLQFSKTSAKFQMQKYINNKKYMATALYNSSLLKLFMCFMYTFFTTSNKIKRYF